MDRRAFAKSLGGLALGATLARPAILRAQTPTLRITTWGGKWGDLMKSDVLPAFGREHGCTVQVDQAFPFVPKLAASPRRDPIYDVVQTNSNEQWDLFTQGLVEGRPDKAQVPNLADVYPYAVSDKIAGVTIFTSAIGLGLRTDKVNPLPTSWKELWDPRFAGVRGSYVIPANSLGQSLLMFSGELFGRGTQDVDAMFKALAALKPVKLVDFTGTMEKLLLSGEVSIGVIHDSGVLRYYDQKQPLAFVSPKEGVLALEQVLTVTTGSPRKELGYAYIDYMLRPDVQKRLAEAVWYSPTNRKVTLSKLYQDHLLTTPEKVATLRQMDWQWYNARKDEFDDRYNRIFNG